MAVKSKTTKELDKPTDGVVIDIYGFPIKLNSLYEVQEKMDSSAPDGFKDNSTSKTLSFDVADGFPGAVFDVQRGMWDNGLYENSKSFIRAFGKDQTINRALFDKVKEYILEPYESQYGEGSLDYKSTDERNAFWDNYRIEIKRGKVFNTGEIKDLLELYFCLVHRILTPKDMESHPDFKQPTSYYLIVDKESSVSRQAEKEMRDMEAKALFFTLMKSDKDRLIRTLDYLGIPASINTDDATLVRVFNNWVENKEDKFQNAKIFLEAIEKHSTDKGKELLFIHSKLKEMHRKGKNVTLKRGQVYLDEVFVDNGWKVSAEKIQSDAELMELFTSLLD